MQEIFDFVKGKARYYFIATIDQENNRPRIRPFGSFSIFEGKLYFTTEKSKQVCSQILANPNVELCTMAEGEWIRIAAKAHQVEDPAVIEYMVESSPRFKARFDEGEGIIFTLSGGIAQIYKGSTDLVSEIPIP
ncbi:MAG: pyridoxamine 5'-phosphate oxidase family protein [Eubacteriaceae bacterium]|nr:pyridoxamine 5'-phosphate oxidase family protein [Eubacteriaceae bacterium]